MIKFSKRQLQSPKFSRPVYLVTAGQTKFDRAFPEKRTEELVIESFAKAAEMIGKSPAELKSYIHSCYYGHFADHFGDQLLGEAVIHDRLGLDPLGNVGIKTGGATGGSTIWEAAKAVASGYSDCVLAMGWVLVAGVFGIHYAYGDILLNSRTWQLALGVSLITLVVLFWLSRLSISKREQFLSFDSDGGMVSISVNAVNAFLAKLKSEFAGIETLHANVSASRNGAVEVHLDMTVRAGTHIQQLSQALQQRVRDHMRESLGIAEVTSVKVNVQDIVSAEGNAGRRQSKSSEWQDADT